MNQNRKIGKSIAAWLLCMAMVLSIVNLPASTISANAAEYSETVSGIVDVSMDEIVYYVGVGEDDAKGLANLEYGEKMPEGLAITVDQDGYVHFIGTPKVAGNYTVSIETEEYYNRYQSDPSQGNFTRTIIIAEPDDVWVNGEKLTSDKLTIECGDGTVTYNPEKQTLTLDSAQITKACDDYAAIISNHSLTINVIGNCQIDMSSNERGIYISDGDLTLSMKGNLTVASKVSAIDVYGSVLISGSGQLNLNTENYGNAIDAGENVVISGSVDVTIVAVGIAIKASENVTISGSGNVNLTARGENGHGIGAYSKGVTLANSGMVTINSDSAGIDSYGNVTISGSGEISIVGVGEGIRMFNMDDKVLLNGTGSPISIESKIPVYNFLTKGNPVEGTNFDKYEVSAGRINMGYVEFTLKCTHQNIANREIRWAEPARCVSDGYTGDIYCTDCGKMLEEGTVIPATGKHDFSQYVSNGNGTHKIVCKDCGVAQEGHEADACVAGADGKCTKCGAIMDGWQKIDGKWKFIKDGEAQTGWIKDAGKWYYFDANGNMKTGWVKDGGKWYYMASSGAMSTGWKQIKDVWYYFGTNGVMVTGWQKISNKWYYFEDGAMVTGWKKISNKWYYFADGVMVEGWKKLDGKWYYFDGGAMVTGWKKLDSKWYYFGTNGVMVSNKTITIDGKKYTFNASGVWVK